MYYYWGSGQYWRSSELFDAWTIVALAVAVAMVHGVWRLWRGMRLDAFERNIRRLRQQPTTSSIRFPVRRQRAPGTRGFQISLLPLMLVSCGLAMLLAQAQRPDDVSRPVTWGLFLAVGAWYGAGAWSHRRGFGPLRNEAFAAIATTTLLSALLWGFYTAVDMFHAEPGYQRLTTSVPILLWWTAVGGAVGGLIGSYRASRIYRKSQAAERQGLEEEIADDSANVPAAAPGAVRKVRWRGSTAAIGLACLASLVVHLAAVPHVYQSIHYQYVLWDHYHTRWDHTLTLTMSQASRPTPWTMPLADTTTINVNGELPDFQVRGHLMLTESYKPGSYPREVQFPAIDQPDAGATLESDSPMESTIYVANRRLPAGTRLTASMFQAKTRSLDSVPADAAVDLNSAVGSIAVRDIEAGATLSSSDTVSDELLTSEKLGLVEGDDLAMGTYLDSAVPPLRLLDTYVPETQVIREITELGSSLVGTPFQADQTKSIPRPTEPEGDEGDEGDGAAVTEITSRTQPDFVDGTELLNPGDYGVNEPARVEPQSTLALPNLNIVQPIKGPVSVTTALPAQLPEPQEPQMTPPKSQVAQAAQGLAQMAQGSIPAQGSVQGLGPQASQAEPQSMNNTDGTQADLSGPMILSGATRLPVDGSDAIEPSGPRSSRISRISPSSRIARPSLSGETTVEDENSASTLPQSSQPTAREPQSPAEVSEVSRSNEEPQPSRNTYPVVVLTVDGRVLGGHRITRTAQSITIHRDGAPNVTINWDKVERITGVPSLPQNASLLPLIRQQLKEPGAAAPSPAEALSGEAQPNGAGQSSEGGGRPSESRPSEGRPSEGRPSEGRPSDSGLSSVSDRSGDAVVIDEPDAPTSENPTDLPINAKIPKSQDLKYSANTVTPPTRTVAAE